MSQKLPLLNTIRSMIDRPDGFTKADLCATLTDAAETIVMLKRVVAKHVRTLPVVE